MNRRLFTALLLFASATFCLGQEKKKKQVPVWTDPQVAAEEHQGFSLQGEYQNESSAIQVAAMSDDKFLVLTYNGGFPNAGWDGEALVSKVHTSSEVSELVASGFKKVTRKSPTLGEKAPEGAVVIFDGEATKHIKGKVENGILWAGASTQTPFKDFKLHLEFRLPFKPDRAPSNQDRGNSGIYIFNNYEVQVLDSFGLDFDKENNAIDLQSDNKQWCGSFYKFKIPDVPMAFPPLTWQTYDIDFQAPRFEGEKKIQNARITVRHNGVVIHDDVELAKGTGHGGSRPEKPEGIINFQAHGNPTAFRNIWILPK